MAAVLDCETPRDIPEKRGMLLRHGIALWDSIGSCEIRGSSDASIDKAAPNDLSPIFRTAGIRQVFCNGKKSHEMYRKFQEKELGRSAVCLPSTSPANAAWSIERLTEEWARQIRPFL